jgi:predicted nucleic acid-binding protein
MRVDEVPERIVVIGEHSDRAVALGPGRELLTSALFWAESGNAIATRVRRGDLDDVRANEVFRDLLAVPLRTRAPGGTFATAALAIARDLTHPIYDCCYLALTVEENCVVVTADQRFHSAVARSPSLTGRVLLLRDIVLH